MNTQDFGKFVAELRKEKGMTQMQLAEKLNVTDKAVSRWETGKNFPDIEIFEDLSKILEVSVSELLEGKRIEKEELILVSEENVVKQIKKNKKHKKRYLVIIALVTVLAMFFGFFAMSYSGLFNGVIYNKIQCYSNDVLTIMNTVDGYLSQDSDAEGEFIINNGFFFLERDKTTKDIFYLSGTCENGRSFYINTQIDEENPEKNHSFIGEFRKNQEPVEGIPFDDLKHIVAQLDLSSLPKYEKYHIRTHEIDMYDNYDLKINDHQKSIIKYVFSDGILSHYNEKTISGKYMLLTITGYGKANDEPLNTGSIFAYIYCEI